MDKNKKHFNLIEICEYIDNININDSSAYQLKNMIVNFVQSIKNEAVDKFSKKLMSDEFQKYNIDVVFETCRELSYEKCTDTFYEYVEDMTKRFKNGDFNDKEEKIC